MAIVRDVPHEKAGKGKYDKQEKKLEHGMAGRREWRFTILYKLYISKSTSSQSFIAGEDFSRI